MNHIRPKFQPLFVLLNECVTVLQADMLRLKCTRDTKSVRKWTAVLNCAATCNEIIENMENNELDKMEANMRKCRIACKKCISYCYTSDLFKNSYNAASKILPQLRV